MELLREILNVIIYTIITGCGIVIIKKLIDYANAKIDNMQANTQLSEYAHLNTIIDQVQQTVAMIVTSVNQVFVDSLKASGKFDSQAASEAKEIALDMAETLLTEEAIKVIEKVHGDSDVYIDSLIEQLVNELKKK